MFKELKVIKLIVLVGLFVSILLKINFLGLSIAQLHTNKLAFQAGETIKIFATTKAFLKSSAAIELTDLDGIKFGNVEIALAQNELSKQEILKNGIGIDDYSMLDLPSKMQSGIYLLGNKYPVVLSGTNSAKVTVVYPALNNLIYQRIDEESVFSAKIDRTSLNRSVEIDPYTIGLRTLFSQLQDQYETNFITDLDLENQQSFFKSELLIVYGKSTFWTPKMRKNIDEYVDSGGNLLLITSYIVNNICWYNSEKKEVLLFDSTKGGAIQSWLGYNEKAPRDIVGSSYLFGGTSTNFSYILNSPKHAILSGVEELSLSAELYNSSPVIWMDNKPFVDSSSINCTRAEVLAYNESVTSSGQLGVKGVFEIQRDSTSGIIINLGTEDWCLKENFENNETLKIVALNAVKYLVK